MRTNFKDIDFPENTLSLTSKQETSNGWDLSWDYSDLVSGYEIGMAMPEKGRIARNLLKPKVRGHFYSTIRGPVCRSPSLADPPAEHKAARLAFTSGSS
jgi:hypothetical protein